MNDYKIIYKSTGEFLRFINQKEKITKRNNRYKGNNSTKGLPVDINYNQVSAEHGRTQE